MQKKQHINKPKAPFKEPKKKKLSSNFWIRILLVVFVLIIYGSSVKHEFTLDDDVFFTNHKSVQKGIKGTTEIFTHGSLENYDGAKGLQPYRPVMLLSFALEKQFLGNGPAIAHFINVLLYIILVLVLFNLLLKLMPGITTLQAAIITLLFAVHPVHAEVVSSVKSRDELLAALFCLLSFSLAINAIKSEKLISGFSILSFICFALALFSKESAIALTPLLPLSFLMLQKQPLKRTLFFSIPYVFLALIFVFIRQNIIGSETAQEQTNIYQNILYGAGSFAELSATKLEILLYYLKLIFIPWPLSWDYSYNQIPLVGWNSFLPWISILIYFSLTAIAIYYFRKIPAISFGIFFFMVTLLPASNLFFINGTAFAERFLFLPSLGLIVALVCGLTSILKIESINKKPGNNFMYGCIGIIFILSCFSFTRNMHWESNLILFEKGVEAAPNSSRANAALANEYRLLAEKERDLTKSISYFNNAIKYYRESIDILPSNTDALYNLGVAYNESGDTTNAIIFYKKTLEYDSTHIVALNNLGVAYGIKNDLDSSLFFLNRSYLKDSSSLMAAENVALINYLKGNIDLSIRYAKQAINISPKSTKAYAVLRNAYFSKGDSAEAAKYQRLYELNN